MSQTNRNGFIAKFPDEQKKKHVKRDKVPRKQKFSGCIFFYPALQTYYNPIRSGFVLLFCSAILW